MDHIRQRHNGCALASLAMVSGISEPMIYQYAVEFGYDDLGCTDKVLEDLLEKLLSYTLPSWDKRRVAIRPTMQSNPSPDLHGEGLLQIAWTDSSAHMLAFKNGKIFDPNCFESHTWKEWTEEIIPFFYSDLQLDWYDIVYRKGGK